MVGTNCNKIRTRPPNGLGRFWRDFRVYASGRRWAAEETAHVIGDGVLLRERLPPGLQLSLDHAELGENAVPFRLEPAHFLIRKVADTADGNAALKNVHRPTGKFAENAEDAEHVLRLL